ncbi:hypothetical protein AVEN_87880-1 [Araneus ventricosus]|uniref:Uncharacterized protein n=1 Tax=Araneus ventricosus TaxID=182803 RepID=A0A4Y2BDJ0_ARAVE|nr:hypothetical protein AVEN_87880-1 [Araneus ventricosus]
MTTYISKRSDLKSVTTEYLGPENPGGAIEPLKAKVFSFLNSFKTPNQPWKGNLGKTHDLCNHQKKRKKSQKENKWKNSNNDKDKKFGFEPFDKFRIIHFKLVTRSGNLRSAFRVTVWTKETRFEY